MFSVFQLTKNGTMSSVEADTLTLDDISEDDLDLDNTEVDDYFFLQPLTTRRRRALLRASGVRRIDVDEKHELRALRMSREECGCRCRGICDAETCACSLAGIKCQVNGTVVRPIYNTKPCLCLSDPPPQPPDPWNRKFLCTPLHHRLNETLLSHCCQIFRHTEQYILKYLLGLQYLKKTNWCQKVHIWCHGGWKYTLQVQNVLLLWPNYSV